MGRNFHFGSEYLFPRRMFKHWNKLSREMMESSSLEMLQTCVSSVSF